MKLTMKVLPLLMIPFLVACGNKKTPKYFHIKLKYESEANFIFVPYRYEKDSFLCFTTNDSPYWDCNIKMMSEDEFQERLCEKCINNEYIEISKEFYDSLERDRLIEIPHIKALYEQEGLKAVLEKYDIIEMWDELDYQVVIYVAYLCWQEDVFITFGGEVASLRLHPPM